MSTQLKAIVNAARQIFENLSSMGRLAAFPRFANWEMLRYEARLALTQQVTALAIGVAAPLLIALYTIFRPWSPLHAMDNLLEAALLLAGWGTLFGILHLCTGWLRPRQQEREAEQRHLPLTSIHFFVRRLLHSSGVLLCSATFSLLCWAALLIYYGRPYLANTDWEENWAYGPRGEADMHWWPMMLCIAAVILGSTLLPVALGVWLEALTTRSELRCLLMLGIQIREQARDCDDDLLALLERLDVIS